MEQLFTKNWQRISDFWKWLIINHRPQAIIDRRNIKLYKHEVIITNHAITHMPDILLELNKQILSKYDINQIKILPRWYLKKSRHFQGLGENWGCSINFCWSFLQIDCKSWINRISRWLPLKLFIWDCEYGSKIYKRYQNTAIKITVFFRP